MLGSQAAHDDRVQGHTETGLGHTVHAPDPLGASANMPDLSECLSALDLRNWLLKFSRSLGFYGGRYIQLARPCWGLDESEPGFPIRHLTTSSQAEREDEHWIASDPSIALIRGTYAPFSWSTRHTVEVAPKQRAWLDGERSRGIDAGLAIPVQDSAGCPAYLSLFGYDEVSIKLLIDKKAPELAFLAGQFHALAKTLVPIANWVGRGPRLSNRELECLRLAALGQTVDESGHTLGISGRTVEFHLRNALDKLGAPTKLRAVVLAFGAGAAAGL
ncbi:LuxR C-terminal-related transcriptional regulator [Sphingomonas sp. dw_22]|uniref:helix-turn-helix transcriptional regulator n=1 Tax=Sphingomonas sp. dw_22 TaxID=2721175 RepID=UPI002116FBC3|nr:LuxR C-terminal-related transcriptional regulator [Sphingomonas sp. dw_22]